MHCNTRSFSRLGVRKVLIASLVVIGLTGFFAQRSVAGLFTLVDENSSADFNTDTQANAFDWIVDGVDQLFQQSFWYRIGNVAEQNVDTLPHPVEGVTDTNFDGNSDTLFVRYNDLNGRGAIHVRRWSGRKQGLGHGRADTSFQSQWDTAGFPFFPVLRLRSQRHGRRRFGGFHERERRTSV
jgi:hypothetical protein